MTQTQAARPSISSLGVGGCGSEQARGGQRPAFSVSLDAGLLPGVGSLG